MSDFGPLTIDFALTFYANTHDPSTGAATDADSAPTYRVYEDETGTAILNGSMALLDSSNTAGFYSEQITLSAANGFEVGKCYAIYVSATVDSVVATMNHSFRIGAALLTTSGIATAAWDELVEPTGSPDYKARELMRLFAAVLLGKVSGLPGSPVFRDANDTKNRVSATTDGDGNRSAVTLDPS